MYPISKIMLPGNSRWIEKSTIWFRPILKFGLYVKTMLPAWPTSGTKGLVAVGGGIGVAAGTGMAPSKPTRKTEIAGSAPGVGVQFAAGVPDASHTGLLEGRTLKPGWPGRCVMVPPL